MALTRHALNVENLVKPHRAVAASVARGQGRVRTGRPILETAGRDPPRAC